MVRGRPLQAVLPASWRFPWRPRASERELARRPGSGDAGLHSASRPSLCAPSPLEGGEPWPAEPRGLRGRPIELGTRGPSPELGIRGPSPSGGPGLAGHGGRGRGSHGPGGERAPGGIGGLLFFLFGIRSHVVGFAAAGKRRPRSLLLPPRDEDPPCTPFLPPASPDALLSRTFRRVLVQRAVIPALRAALGSRVGGGGRYRTTGRRDPK